MHAYFIVAPPFARHVSHFFLEGFEGREERSGGVIELPQFSADAETEDSLARAARAGKAISPEIEKIMCHDREAAEREMDDGQTNQNNQEDR